jgi:hypothetical protein
VSKQHFYEYPLLLIFSNNKYIHNSVYETCGSQGDEDVDVGFINFSPEDGGSIKMAVFWIVAPCSLVEVYRRSRVACCLHHDDGGSNLGPETGYPD